MTKEEAEQLRRRASEVNAQKQKQDLEDQEIRYNAWFAKNIESIENQIRREAELGHAEFEVRTRRDNIPEKVGEHWYAGPYSIPRQGTRDIMDYLEKLGFRCAFRPGRWCSDVIIIYLI